MAITVNEAVAYINDEARALKFLQLNANYGSWVKPSVASGAKSIKFRKTTFSTNALGSFSASTGYAQKGYTVEWIDAALSHDAGDSLQVDVVDNGASLGGDVVALYNNYQAKVYIPGTSANVYADVLATTGITSTTTALTKDNIVATILADLAALEENGVDVATAGLEIRVNPTVKALLLEVAMNKGQFTLGGYAFNFGANPTEFQGISIITVPSAQLGTNVNYILAPKDAVGVYFIFNDAKYFDAVPGFGSRKHQIDVGSVFGAIVCPGCESYVRVSKSA